ncbi:hypothetical protein [Lactobacillus sp. Sy-1]|uniref:hypothetical protein n=1 Tax=Lactobacillus sp. Sy-1 TaxID=2109645 RepID=UPI001C5A7EBE|nr:hypothetical protein [Lactobacillus sp. Sy-1]MBW1606125.1 replication initiator protein A [Lactobacillus sp. Sy-1]
MQFIMLDVDLIQNHDLTNDEIVAYALLCDRMKSSRTSRQFYDSKLNDFYVIYTLEQMADSLKVSVRKVGQIFNKLVKLGFVTKKKQFSKADKLFLPKFTEPDQQNLPVVAANSATPQTQKLQTNQSHQNQKNQSEIDTVNTVDHQPQRYSSIEKWKNSVCGKLHVDQMVVDQILDFTKNDLTRAHQIMGIILNAKTNVAKINGLIKSPKTRFENNTNLGSKLAVKLKHIFSYLPAKLEEQAKYLMTALKTFFTEAFGLKKDEKITPVANSDLKIIEQPIPEWMEKDYQDNSEEISEAQRLATEKLIRNFHKR